MRWTRRILWNQPILVPLVILYPVFARWLAWDFAVFDFVDCDSTTVKMHPLKSGFHQEIRFFYI